MAVAGDATARQGHDGAVPPPLRPRVPAAPTPPAPRQMGGDPHKGLGRVCHPWALP